MGYGLLLLILDIWLGGGRTMVRPYKQYDKLLY